ncbi:MAG: Wzy polymerase domain-containing protein [Polaromonas sp.]
MTKRAQGQGVRLIYLVGFIVFGLPALVGYGTIPLTNFTAEALCVTGLALMLILAGIDPQSRVERRRELLAATGAFGLLFLVTLLQWTAFGQKQIDAYLVVLGYLLCAVMAVGAGHAACAGDHAMSWFRASAKSLAIAATLAAFASAAQYFELDARWLLISPVSDAGRTFGFIRQPNHQGTFLNLGLVALIFLQRTGSIRTWLWSLLSLILIFGITTTGSRTALLQVFFISLCMLASSWRDRRGLLKAVLPIALVAGIWLALFLLSRSGGTEFFGVQKLAQTSSEGLGMRSAAWRQTAIMVMEHPWAGNGILRYSAAFFLGGAGIEVGVGMSHSHNLLLQVAFDFGLPVAILFFGLIAWVLWRARGTFVTNHGFFAFVCLGCLFIHSLVEFPLWYAYFLLPACWLLGSLTCGRRSAAARQDAEAPHAGNHGEIARASKALRAAAVLAGIAVLGVTLSMNRDYYLLTPVYAPGLVSTQAERLKDAERVFWFRRYADFPGLQLETVNETNYELHLKRAASIGCVMTEIWFQNSTILALAQSGRIDEAKWILYIIWRMSNGQVDSFKKALMGSKLPVAAQLVDYLQNPVPVPKATTTFQQACYGRAAS